MEYLDDVSRDKIYLQMRYTTTNKMPGLLSGIFVPDGLGEGNDKSESNNNAMCWLAGAREVCSTGVKSRQSCEVCFSLSYAGRPLNLTLLFTPCQPWMAPDLFIHDKHFMDIITSDMLHKYVSCLKHWPEGKENAVAELLHQIFAMYKRYQMLKLQTSQYSDMHNKYSQFIDEMKLKETELEVFLSDTEQVLCVRLPLHFDALPSAVFPECRGVASCVLQFTTKTGSGTFSRPCLHLSPRAASLLVGDSPEELPPIPVGCDSLVAYTLTVMEDMKDRVKQAYMAYEIRKQIVAQLLCKYDAAISRYDKVRFTTIELLLQEDDFHYMVDISFPPPFPSGCGPRVRLRSICQEEGEEAVSGEVPHVSHSHPADPETVVAAVFRAATAYAPTFRRLQRSHRQQLFSAH